MDVGMDVNMAIGTEKYDGDGWAHGENPHRQLRNSFEAWPDMDIRYREESSQRIQGRRQPVNCTDRDHDS